MSLSTLPTSRHADDSLGALMLKQRAAALTGAASVAGSYRQAEKISDPDAIAALLASCSAMSDEGEDDLVFELLYLETLLAAHPLKGKELLKQLGELGEDVREGLLPPGIVDLAVVRRRTRALRQQMGVMAGRITAAMLVLLTSMPFMGQEAQAAKNNDHKSFQIASAPVVRVVDANSGSGVPGVQIKSMEEKLLGVTDATGQATLSDEYMETDLLSLEKDGYQMYLLDRSQLSSRNIVSMKPLKDGDSATALLQKAPTAPKVAAGDHGHAPTVTAPKPPVAPKAPQVKLPIKPKAPRVVDPHAVAAAPKAPAAHDAHGAPAMAHDAHAAAAHAPAAHADAHAAAPKAPAAHDAPKPAAHGDAHAAAPKAPAAHDAHAPAAHGETHAAPKAPAHVAAAPAGHGHEAAPAHGAPVVKAPVHHDAHVASTAHDAVAKPAAPRTPMMAAHETAVEHHETTGVAVPKRMPMPKLEVESEEPTTHASSGEFYKVRAGDTLSAVAKAHLGSARRWPEIYAANRDKLRNPHWLKVGQVISIPAAGTAMAHQPVKHYVVKPGDSLSRIAGEVLGDVRQWHKIYTANRTHIRNPHYIYPGQRLVLPG